MAWQFNPFTGKLDYFVDSGVLITASDPTSPSEGDMIINSSTNQMKIYYGGAWQVLHTLTPASGVGVGYWVIGTDFVVS